MDTVMKLDPAALVGDEDSSGGASVEAAVHELESITEDDRFDSQWHVLDLIYPGNEQVWTAMVKRQIKRKAFDEAIAAIDAHDFGDEVDELALLRKAELLYDARCTDRAEEHFESLIERFPEHREIRVSYAKRLFANGHVARADTVLVPVRYTVSEGTQTHALCDRAAELNALLADLEGAPIPLDQDARILAMKHAILRFRDRTIPFASSPGLGRLSLITGSLGPGGAERQLTRLAIELERAQKSTGEIGGVQLSRPVEVVVRSHGPEKQNDFYLDEMRATGVELRQINLFDPVSAKVLGIEDPEMLQLLDYLPPSVNYGVKRLTKYFRESGTDTASAWQDGACLFAGLAALIAGVPSIQLAIRGLPPSMRRHMYRPEYEVLYRAMAQVPGVSFISNNLASAHAYAEWLDIPLDRFSIVYNGVEPMLPKGSPACEKMWNAFVEATPDATHTIGGVFRFDTDKQPNLWIRYAARYLKRHPETRIVLVGGGRLLEGAKDLARELGIIDRILFTDRSTRVGYWMTKMDVMALLSRYEGLPNVLIEAQYMGVRVITTPAGGAAECLIDGTTGYVLDCVEKPDLEKAVARTNELARAAIDRDLFAEGGAGRQFLDRNFSVPHMLAQYVNCTARGLGIADESISDRALRAA